MESKGKDVSLINMKTVGIMALVALGTYVVCEITTQKVVLPALAKRNANKDEKKQA